MHNARDIACDQPRGGRGHHPYIRYYICTDTQKVKMSL